MNIQVLKDKIESFRKKYYLNQVLKGSLQFFIVFGLITAVVSILEYYFWFSRGFRSFLFFGVLIIFISLLILWVILPLMKYFRLIKSDFSEIDLAQKIGKAFPEIEDKLINALQLKSIALSDNSLVLAGIDQYMGKLKPIPFNTAINLRVNLKYGKYLGFIMLSILMVSWIIPGIYQNSTNRLINFQEQFTKPAPFQFSVLTKDFQAFRNEDFTLQVALSGTSIPDALYALIDGRRITMVNMGSNEFSLVIRNIQKSQSVQFEGGAFLSQEYFISVVERADLLAFEVEIISPEYTREPKQQLKNTGNITIAEGSVVTWNFVTKATENVSILLQDSTMIDSEKSDNQLFKAKSQFRESIGYQINVSNEYAQSKENINYQINVIKDQLPEISASFYLDTILYEYIIVTGAARDDYGISALKLVSKQGDKVETTNYRTSGLAKEENYYFQYSLDSLLKTNPENALELYVSVTDNDAVNGRKSVRSGSFQVKLPRKEDIDNALSKKSSETGDKLEKAVDKANSINEKIKELQERLLSKQKLEWQEEKLLNELLEQRKRIEESMQELQDQFEELNEAQNKFDDRSDDIQEKAQQLQQLMNDVLDEETKRLYEELQQLMEKNAELDDLREKLDQLAPNESNLENELERALELFKRLKVEAELEKASKNLENLGDKQEQLSVETQSSSENDNQESGEQSLSEKQEQINDSFDKIKEQIEKAQELNQELKNPEPLQDIQDEMEEIQKGLDKAKDQLEQKDFENGIEQQKKNSQQLKKLGEQLSQMMEGMQMEMLSEDIDNLRNILDNLVKLSFEQERIIDGFYQVTQVDPQFVELSQRQLKLDDDAQILEDSLLALAERVAQVSTFITREIGEVNYNLDAAMESLRNRDRNKALSNQQFAMASINNLALLLDDLLQQLQNSMASSMGKGKPKDEKDGSMPNLQQLQQQLSQQIQELKDSGMKGRQLSEQLAKMAAQQEMLREKMEEMKKALKGQEGGEEAGKALDDAMKLMEENEVDLVNKRLTQQLIDRQEKILTRMLDAENAMQEQDFDDEREAETPGLINRNLPKAFEEYLEERRKEIELLKTVPIDLNPFYKKEVNDYFRRISIDN